MADTFLNYSPDLIIVTWGAIIISGYADGEFVTAERDEDAYQKKIGATGDVVRVRSLNRGGSIKIVLQQSARTNDLLSAAYALDQGFNSFQTLPMMIKDLNGTTLIHAANTWIKKLPGVMFGKDLSNREWVFDCANIDTFISGGSVL
jgi:Protein of unknown function (DUF3277)